MTVAFLVLTALVAAADWVAVARRMRGVELAAKPLTLVLLIVAAGFADLGDAKPWVVAALVFGLLGDVALLFADEGSTDVPFLIGLGSFLVGHLAYVAAFSRHGLHGLDVVAGGLVVGGATVLALPRVLRSARRSGGTGLAAVVGLYAAALATMTVLGVGTAAVLTAIGALLFLASDLTLAWDRFVQPLLRGPVLVAVTYHLAQLLIVIGLIR
ncbi:MAG: YhhN family protein [Pseudonocardiales bacterium]|nr:YhhN family protein [Pseudonocardiales bacterium]